MHLPTISTLVGAFLLLSSSQTLAHPAGEKASITGSYESNENATEITSLDTAQLSKRSYMASCNPGSCTLVNTWELQCNCIEKETSSGPNFLTSKLHLGWCLTNNDGFLDFVDTGNLHVSCRDPWLFAYSSIFGAECQKKNGEWWDTDLYLDAIIANTNGILSCYGHKGTRV